MLPIASLVAPWLSLYIVYVRWCPHSFIRLLLYKHIVTSSIDLPHAQEWNHKPT